MIVNSEKDDLRIYGSYTYYMPDKEELIAQVEKVINENEDEKE